jgi:hypothetical protein
VSAIWAIAKDVLAATWSIPTRRLMGITLRLSIVIGIVVGAVTLVHMHFGYARFVDAQIKERVEIHFYLKCAQRYNDETLLKYVEKPGGRDINLRRIGCSENDYWTNLLEIRSEPKDPRVPNFDDMYSSFVDPQSAVGGGILSTALVIGLGLLLVLVRLIAMWVIGTERA